MRAYAILDGGGVKGAALAGCLKAAEERGISFAGYGGTSAGAIVALLACVGYTPTELRRIMTEEVDFRDFLDDSGAALDRLRATPARARSVASLGRYLLANWHLVSRLRQDFGLYHGRKLHEFLLTRIKQQLPAFALRRDVTFEDLHRLGLPALKIVASDITLRRPVVYSAAGGDEINGSIIEAARASMSYPFVFRPMRVGDRYLVDGGLSSNLPVFLFEQERRRDRLPVIAFDLMSTAPMREDTYGVGRFLGDLLGTALEASEHLLRQLAEGVYAVPVPIPPDIGTLDFGLSSGQRAALFNAGHSATHSFFADNVGHWGQVRSSVEQLQALHVPAALVTPLLQALAARIEADTAAISVRANIMLPTDRDTLLIAYQFGMDEDPDVDLELALDAGCSGAAWSSRDPQIADLVVARSSYPSWNMTRPQQNRVRPDRKAVLSVPMFDVRRGLRGAGPDTLDMLGVLSLDTSTPLADTRWADERRQDVVPTVQRWADILARLLT